MVSEEENFSQLLDPLEEALKDARTVARQLQEREKEWVREKAKLEREFSKELLDALTTLEKRHQVELNARALELSQQQTRLMKIEKARLQEELLKTQELLEAAQRPDLFNKQTRETLRTSLVETKLRNALMEARKEAKTARDLAEERVASAWLKQEAAEEQLADLQEEHMVLQKHHQEATMELNSYRAKAEEEERQALARRIATDPHPTPTDPHIRRAIEAKLEVRGGPAENNKADSQRPKFQAPKLSTTQARLTPEDDVVSDHLSQGDTGENPFVDDYDPNEDDQVRFFSDPLIADLTLEAAEEEESTEELSPPVRAADDRLFPGEGALDEPVEVQYTVPPGVPWEDEVKEDYSIEDPYLAEAKRLAQELGVPIESIYIDPKTFRG